MMTPLELDMLVWFCGQQDAFPNIDLAPQQAAVAKFMRDGIIDPTSGPIWRATEKGQAWLRMILNTPMPVPTFADPRAGVAPAQPAAPEPESFPEVALPPGFIPWAGASADQPKPPGYAQDRDVVTFWRNGNLGRGMPDRPVAFGTINWKHTGKKDDIIGYYVLPLPDSQIIKSGR